MRRVLMVAYEGVQTLDLVGPAEVFAFANRGGRTAYEIEFAMVGGGNLRTSSGLCVSVRDLLLVCPQANDTIVVSGAAEAEVRQVMKDASLSDWLREAATRVERMTSVCSGSFVLAKAGLLDGKCAATHWLWSDDLAREFPRVCVDARAVFVRDGSVWTSAGVTTGIDMALAIVEDDLGRAVADAIASLLVLYVRRIGAQAQFSEALLAQVSNSDPLGAALAWVRSHLDRADVEALAQHCGLSVRTLHRHCLSKFGVTPAKLLNTLRVEHARTLLVTTDLSAKLLAAQCGFSGSPQLKRVFQYEMGITPEDYRASHSREWQVPPQTDVLTRTVAEKGIPKVYRGR